MEKKEIPEKYKKVLGVSVIAAFMLLAGLAILPTASATGPTTFNFGSVTLSSSGSTDSGHFAPVFDF